MPHVPFSAVQNGSLTPLRGLLSSSISQTRELKKRKVGEGGGEYEGYGGVCWIGTAEAGSECFIDQP